MGYPCSFNRKSISSTSSQSLLCVMLSIHVQQLCVDFKGNATKCFIYMYGTTHFSKHVLREYRMIFVKNILGCIAF